ncbi:hypothetical protein Tco_0428031 [Tanacetum coccineum]
MAEYSQKWHNGTSRTRSTKTSDGLVAIQAQLNNIGREIKKVNEKVYAVQVGCEQCKGPHYTKDCPIKEEGTTLEEACYTQFGAPFQQGGQYRATALGFYQRNNANPIFEWVNEQRVLWKEDLEVTLVTETNPKDHVKSISTTVEADITPIRRIKSSQYAVSAQQNSKLMLESGRTTIPFPSRLNDYYCDKKKDRMERNSWKLTHMKIHISTIPYPERRKTQEVSLYLAILVILRERMDLDLEAKLMGEILVLNRSLDPSYGDYIELNDLNLPLELRRDQVDDLMPTIEECGVIDEPMIDIIKTRNNESFDEYLMMSREFYDSITKDKVESKGKNVWKIWMATEIKTWEILFLENRSAKLHVWKHEVIMEYLVKISKKARILELKRRNMKKLTLTSYTPYPSRKIRRICACTSQKTTKE